MHLNRKRMPAGLASEILDYTTHERSVYDEFMEARARPVELPETLYRTGASYHAYAAALLTRNLSIARAKNKAKVRFLRNQKAKPAL